MKILIFSDLHLHNWKYGASIGSNGINTRLQHQANFLEYIWQYHIDNQIDKIVFCGDLFHTHGRLDTEVMNVALDGFARLGEGSNVENDPKCVMLVGNHDMKSKDGRINAVQHFDKLGWKVVYPDTVSSPWSHCAFYSYTDEEQKFSWAMGNCTNSKYLFLHQGVRSVPVGSGFEIPNEFLDPNKIAPSINFVFTGHYHRHQQVSDKLVVIGSPMQHTWSDAGEDRGFIVLDTDTDSWKFISYKNSPKFVEVNLESYKSVPIKGNFIRVTGKVDDPDEVREELYKMGAESVEFRVLRADQKISKLSVPNFEKFSLNDVIEQFEKEKELDDKTIGVGQKLRNKTYEAPN